MPGPQMPVGPYPHVFAFVAIPAFRGPPTKGIESRPIEIVAKAVPAIRIGAAYKTGRYLLGPQK